MRPLLDQVDEQLQRLESEKGRGVLNGDDLLDLRRLSLIVNTIEQSDSRIAGLGQAVGADDWRSDAEDGRGDSESASDRIQAVLEELT